MFNRRQFLQLAGAGTAGLLAGTRAYAEPFPHTPPLAKFIQPLPGLGPAGIPVASSVKHGNADSYVISMRQFQQNIHPALPDTTFWGYADARLASYKSRYLGPAIVAKRGTPVEITYLNELPGKHPLPVDTSLTGADPRMPVNRVSPHLHGGFVPWTSDGGPMSWFTPGNAMVGDDFLSNQYLYPNQQSSRLMWYHDHAMGITRLNAYAGLAAPYILRDELENMLIQLGVLPGGAHEVPLVIQDKAFHADGSLGYANTYDPDRWTYGPDDEPPAQNCKTPLPFPSCVPEFFGDTILVNGAAYPAVNVEARAYRFRVLNGSQARFFNLQLYYAQAGSPSEPNFGKAGPAFIQIGNECGFLPAPVVLNNPPTPFSAKLDDEGNPIPSTMKFTLLLAPAERADIIVDFANVPPGSKLILYNDAPAPFPGGDPENDHTSPGSGPDTRTLLQFQVTPRQGAPDLIRFRELASALSLLGTYLAPAAFANLSPALAGPVYPKTLNEDYDDYGRLIQRLGTTSSLSYNNQRLPTYGLNFDDPATEVVRAGDIQVWRIFNLTGDTHPMHFHLVNVQVLGRAPFGTDDDHPSFENIGPWRKPDLNEHGFKETVRMNPGEVTDVIMKFDLPTPLAPRSKRTGGYNYVWHCHILEHEEHDMMRPLIVKP